MARSLEEKRRYLRLNNALAIEYILPNSDRVYTATTKDISALGIRFTSNDRMQIGSLLEIKLSLPNAESAIHASGRVAWLKKIGLEDNAPFDIGIEFLKIEEDNKNTFLKYLCDLIYG
ncbi:MAG: PilZ domain-containing protein [Candidatus Omnitrophica bacterium]|nr:PilZ domain-containing protein [Candidatus Omnitrophota bacterium]